MKEKIHVLLIEDSAVDARLVKGILEHDEDGIFTLQHALTLEEGLRLLAPDSLYRVILLDLGLPGTTGLETLRRIMRKNWGSPHCGRVRTITSSRARYTAANCEGFFAMPSSGTSCPVSSSPR